MSFIIKLQDDRRREIVAVLVLAFTTLLFLALVTDGYQGDNARKLSGMSEVPNALGEPGALVAGILYILLGHAAHALYFITAVWGVKLMRHAPLDRLPTRILGLFLLTGAIAGLLHMDLAMANGNALPGGIFGAFVGSKLVPVFGIVGCNVIALTMTLIGILLATEFLVVRMFVRLHEVTMLLLRGTLELYRNAGDYFRERRVQKRAAPQSTGDGKKRTLLPGDPEQAREEIAKDLSRIRIKTYRSDAQEDPDIPFDDIPRLDDRDYTLAEAEEQLELVSHQSVDAAKTTEPSRVPEGDGLPRRKSPAQDDLPVDYKYPKRYTKPPLEMLDPPTKSFVPELGEQLRETSALLEETLTTFGIEAQVTDVTRGPTITRFELEPAPGVKVNRFLALADDLALTLKAHRVRVEAPIPGKGRVGIEVPNENRESVVLRELLESKTFRSHPGKLALALGKDIAGEVVVTDLATMPHLLVAGATGAGKTICVKTLLASLLFSKSPDELQLMLIDPKMVELSIFNDIPHLITPVTTDPKKAATALNWLINEMEERYRLFAHLRVRNIEVYNESVENGEIELPPETEGESESVDVVRKLPYIVAVIDELADLMMLARAEVEDAIARLAQLARAVGIHLVIATQRPSVDVLTGVIKANFPARISFQVSSRVDSRCILDEIGAERLIGQGDMLYLPPGQSKPRRTQGAFVSDQETNTLIAYLKSQAPPQYRDEIENFGQSRDAVADLEDETDELFDDAVKVVLDTGQASISMVQRRLRVGYTRAARLIDMMELKGIVGPHTGSKAREILVSSQANNEVA